MIPLMLSTLLTRSCETSENGPLRFLAAALASVPADLLG